MENTTQQNDIAKTFSELVEILAAKLTDKISEQAASEAMAKLEDRLPSLENSCDLDERVTALKKQVECLDVDRIDEQLGRVEDRVDCLDSNLDDVKSELEDIESFDEDRVKDLISDELSDSLREFINDEIKNSSVIQDSIKQYLTENLQITFNFDKNKI